MKTKDIKNVLMSHDQNMIMLMYEDLYDEYYKLVYYIVLKILKNTEDTEEVVNEAFQKAFNNIHKFDYSKDESNFKAWLVRIAKNEAINYYNKYKNKKLILNNDGINQVKSENSLDNFLMEFQEILSSEELDVLLMKIYYKMKFKDISESLDKDINDVYYIYKKALNTLKQYYKRNDFRG